jgi:hypothetical protein
MTDYACSIQQQSITVHFMNGDAFVWPHTHARFNEVKQALKDRASGEVIRGLMDDLGRVAEAVAQMPKKVANHLEVSREGVFYKGKPLHLSICDRIVQHANEGFDIEPMVKFLEKLLTNARREAVVSLYDFMAANDIPIAPDGDFLVYKRVRADYKDIHSGTFDNSVGQKPRVELWEVEADRDQTCAQGLHVCSRAYLPHFGSYGANKVVICKVNPADVVAVPRDYNNAKMRVCGYEVVGELTNEQMAEIFDQARVVTPSDHDAYVNWGENTDWHDSEDEDGDFCEDCGWNEDDCECNGPEDEDAMMEEEAIRRAEDAEIERQIEEAEAEAPPVKKSWFKW